MLTVTYFFTEQTASTSKHVSFNVTCVVTHREHTVEYASTK